MFYLTTHDIQNPFQNTFNELEILRAILKFMTFKRIKIGELGQESVILIDNPEYETWNNYLRVLG